MDSEHTAELLPGFSSPPSSLAAHRRLKEFPRSPANDALRSSTRFAIEIRMSPPSNSTGSRNPPR
jgi:hypothetical protein